MLKSQFSVEIDARFLVFTKIPTSYFKETPFFWLLQNNRSPFLGDIPGFLPWGARKY